MPNALFLFLFFFYSQVLLPHKFKLQIKLHWALLLSSIQIYSYIDPNDYKVSWRESFFFFRGAWHHRVTSRQRIHVKDRFNRTTRPIENVETALSATSMKGTADSAQRHHDLTALQIAKAQHEDRPWNPFYKLLLSSLYFAWNTFHIVFFFSLFLVFKGSFFLERHSMQVAMKAD